MRTTGAVHGMWRGQEKLLHTDVSKDLVSEKVAFALLTADSELQ